LSAQNENLVFGINPVLEMLHARGGDVDELLLAIGSERDALIRVAREARRRGLRVVSVERKVLDRLAEGQRHQGVIARVKAYEYFAFEGLLQRIAADASAEWILILDGLTDPRNFGALLRTAEAAGIHHVVIPKDRSVEITAMAVKASAGAAYHVNVSRVTNLRRAIEQLKERGYWIVGLDSGSRETIYEKDYPARLAIVLGSEGKGMRPIILRECDFLVSIPMLGKVASLNVGAAAAIFFYEMLRQKLNLSRSTGR
jgi:23S rRNA (guanosine2251-2'-O)-methyltransferase